MNDGWFSKGAAWSPDEKRVVYVAEAPVGDATPQWGASNGNGNGNGDKGAADKGAADKKEVKAAPKGWRGVGEYQEDWGELNTGKKAPALFMFDTTTGEARQHPSAIHDDGNPLQ